MVAMVLSTPLRQSQSVHALVSVQSTSPRIIIEGNPLERLWLPQAIVLWLLQAIVLWLLQAIVPPLICLTFSTYDISTSTPENMYDMNECIAHANKNKDRKKERINVIQEQCSYLGVFKDANRIMRGESRKLFRNIRFSCLD
jgi:hypothetical protein